MKRIMKYLTGLVFLLTVSGCIPDQAVIWSPDGKQAIVLSDGNMYRCTPDGALSEKLLGGVFRAAWLSDSTHLVIARSVEFSQWEQAKDYLLPKDQERIAELTQKINTAYEALGDIEQAAESLLEDIDLLGSEVGLIGLYAKAYYPEMVTAAELEEDVESASVHLIELLELRNGALGSKRTLGSALMLPVWSLRVSPDDTAAAFSSGEVIGDDADPASLYVVSLKDGAAVRKVADHVTLYPDWTRDSRSLVYAASDNAFCDDEPVSGRILSQCVCDEKGLLETFEEPDLLVYAMVDSLSRVRCLPDESLVFSAFEVSFPAVPEDLPEQINLFRFDPQHPSSIGRVVPRDIQACLGDLTSLFEPSPDGRHIAFVGSDDRISVLDVSAGQLTQLQKEVAESDSLPPGWRNNDELTCVSKGTNGVSVLHYFLELSPVTESSEFNTNWPEEVLDGFFDD
ncbi:MAG: hypothetical protein GXY61_12250 [Lentisphaerae bacterium]|nr:hypothetical protein [Lentisphaerota bacterium]